MADGIADLEEEHYNDHAFSGWAFSENLHLLPDQLRHGIGEQTAKARIN